MEIKIKRIYDKALPSDGFRILVDRLWPRGLSKDRAKIDRWMKDVAPSSELRRWFHADKIKRLAEFEIRYKTEIGDNGEITALKKIIRAEPHATLVTAVKDFEHSHMPILLKQLSKT